MPPIGLIEHFAKGFPTKITVFEEKKKPEVDLLPVVVVHTGEPV